MTRRLFLLALLLLANTPCGAQEPPEHHPAMPRQSVASTQPMTPSSIRVSGFTDVSYTASSARSSQAPMGFDDRANRFLLEQNWVHVEQAPATEGEGLRWGFHADAILPGSDYRFTKARGLFDKQNGLYGIDPIYFAVDATSPNVAKGLELHLGRQSTLFGEESNEADKNLLGSHTYTFIYNPFTHTGLVAGLTLSDDFAVQAGIVLGSDAFIDDADKATFIGSVRVGPADTTDTALFSWVLGPGTFDAVHGFNNPDLIDLLYTHKFSNQVTVDFEGLYGWQSGVPGLGDVDWWGLVPYLSYTFSPRWSSTLRLELFNDAQGQRTGFAGRYETETLGLCYRPDKRLQLRAEYRHDSNDDSAPFEGRGYVNTVSVDAIWKW